jgi:hypothetical protein
MFLNKNKITENHWKIAENICTPPLKGSFLTWSDRVLQLFGEKEGNQRKNSWNQLNNWKKSFLHLVKSKQRFI